MGTVTTCRPHDLVRLRSPEAITGPLPAWAAAALEQAPWAVVRRDRTGPRAAPVGIRGSSRGERHAAVVDLSDVAETVPPAALSGLWEQLPDVPAATALRDAAAILNPTGVPWGPGGSVGFTLATGVRAVTANSDLDLVLRVDTLPPLADLTAWHHRLSRLPARADCQLDLPLGGVSLADLVGPSALVLLRTANGPLLVDRAELSA